MHWRSKRTAASPQLRAKEPSHIFIKMLAGTRVGKEKVAGNQLEGDFI